MTIKIDQERVNDTAKLIIHRLIARQVGLDPSLIDCAKVSLARSSQHYEDYSFVREWFDVLEFPSSAIRRLLINRGERMTRLRLSSPFVLADGVDFGNETLRRRIWRAAKRVARRSTFRNTPGVSQAAV